MSDIKWVQLSVNMIDNRKIKRIRRLPDGNNVVLFWVFLLTKAGESNKKGGLFFLENMPYTVDDLAEEFEFTHDFVNFALSTLEKLQMIVLFDDIIYIKNWEKYQNVEGMERVRRLNAERNRRYRQRKKLKQLESQNDNGDVNVTSRDGTDIDKELEEDKELDKEVIPYVEIINYLNNSANKNYRSSTKKTKGLIQARWNEGFRLNEFKKVIDIKVAEWINDQNMQKYIRPETLFGTKFESYLNQQSPGPNGYDPNDDAF